MQAAHRCDICILHAYQMDGVVGASPALLPSKKKKRMAARLPNDRNPVYPDHH
uniref:Uncharacterized protein n=1 Tax=Arundo donax TaxID=35708 RepID=A0A0A9BHF6_ARUDO